MDYIGDLVLREIPYGKRKVKWSYDVIADRSGRFDKDFVLPSRVVLRHIIKGGVVELIDENGTSLCVLKSQAKEEFIVIQKGNKYVRRFSIN